jgi:predicted nucleotidyltransferase
VDILVDFETESFSAYFGLLNYSEDLLGVHVDLVVPSALRPQIRGSVMAEAVSVA